MTAQQPYLYDSSWRDSRLPEKEFDPKAVTRASWEPKPRRPKQNGPFISFNRHPDAHEVPTGRTSQFRPMSRRTKNWIVRIRHFQLFLRVLELVAGCGLVVLMVLITQVDPLVSWVMRISPGVAALTCVYAIWHLARPAGSRPPASSAAYQLFAALADLAILPFYAFGAISVVNHGEKWSTLVDKTFLQYLVPAEYYTLIGAGGLHVVSLVISAWLAVQFRRITKMPPDMNPLEGHLTRRAHKRNKSSVATSEYSLVADSVKRLSTPLESRQKSGAPYETVSRPPSIPFMHTRQGSGDSVTSSKRDSRMDLPSRQYQIVPGNSARNSVASLVEPKRMSAPPRSPQRVNYNAIPSHEMGSPQSKTDASRPHSMAAPSPSQPTNASPTRVARFTEAWYASDSLIGRTRDRERAMEAGNQNSRAYEAINQRYDLGHDEDDYSDLDQENGRRGGPMDVTDDENDDGGSPINATGLMHPNPLRSHPTPPAPPKLEVPRLKTPIATQKTVLGEVSLNSRSVSGSRDIADEMPRSSVDARRNGLPQPKSTPSWGLRNRDSSIQPEEHFYAKPYGQLKPATPPVIIGSGRQVSSGNDFDVPQKKGYRRNVSGKVAEEGLAGPKSGYSRYSVLNI